MDAIFPELTEKGYANICADVGSISLISALVWTLFDLSGREFLCAS